MKRMVKRWISFVLTMALLITIVPANIYADTKIPYSDRKLIVGDTDETHTTEKYEELGKKKGVKWSSSNTNVVSVNSKGVVKAKKPGKATITAKYQKKNYKWKYTVIPKAKKELITYSVLEDKNGDHVVSYVNKNQCDVSMHFTMNYYDEEGKEITNTSLEEYCIGANQKSMVQFWRPRDKHGELINYADCKLDLSVDNIPVESMADQFKISNITCKKSCVRFKISPKTKLKYLPDTGGSMIMKVCVASYDKQNQFLGYNLAYLYLKDLNSYQEVNYNYRNLHSWDEQVDHCEVWVGNCLKGDLNVSGESTSSVESFYIKPLWKDLSRGDCEIQLGSKGALTTSWPDKRVTWKSSNKNVAVISSDGIVTTKKAGKFTVTATCGKKKASMKVVVKKANVEDIKYKVLKPSINGDLPLLEMTNTGKKQLNVGIKLLFIKDGKINQRIVAQGYGRCLPGKTCIYPFGVLQGFPYAPEYDDLLFQVYTEECNVYDKKEINNIKSIDVKDVTVTNEGTVIDIKCDKYYRLIGANIQYYDINGDLLCNLGANLTSCSKGEFERTINYFECYYGECYGKAVSAKVQIETADDGNY